MFEFLLILFGFFMALAGFASGIVWLMRFHEGLHLEMDLNGLRKEIFPDVPIKSWGTYSRHSIPRTKGGET